jgi:hypothetical protein
VCKCTLGKSELEKLLATKEDILEQLVEEYLIHKGYFVRHNIKYLPSKDHPDYLKQQDSNHSDIDVLGYNPLLPGTERILAVSCKSWQFGFDPAFELRSIAENRVAHGRDAWKAFRELARDKWADGFLTAIRESCGSDTFTYVLAVAKLRGERAIWENHQPFIERLQGNPIKIITFREMIEDVYSSLGTTLAGSEVGRMLQMFKAAGIKL